MNRILSFLYYISAYFFKGHRRTSLLLGSLGKMPINSPALSRAHLFREKMRPDQLEHAILHNLRRLSEIAQTYEESKPNEAFVSFVLDNWRDSRAQLFQDLWVLFQSDRKQGGFFVEFGATDGREKSNTWLLEKKYGWKGILSEPNPVWADRLKANRIALIDFRCVWKKSGEKLQFDMASDPELAGISQTAQADMHQRLIANTTEVETISLDDLLDKNDAPAEIDFLSIDTEGSELEILEAYPFKTARPIHLIAVEHNFVDDKLAGLDDLLLPLGYERVFASFSCFDGWYVLKACQ